MYKLPKGIKIIIFILLCGLQFFVLTLIKTVYIDHKLGYIIEFSEFEYYICFGIISIIAIGIGLIFPLNFSAWTLDTIIDRMNNIITINNIILALWQKKIKLIIETPALARIPDPIKVIVSEKPDYNKYPHCDDPARKIKK